MGVEACEQVVEPASQRLLVQRPVDGAEAPRLDLPHGVQRRGPGGLHVRPALPPRTGEPRQQIEHPHAAGDALARKVRTREEGLLVGRHHDRERPPSLPGHQLAHRHVDAVDVRPLLAVHLDRDEVPVEERRHVRVLERLVLHHVAPVTGGVADGEEDGAVLGPAALERLLPPRIPVHGIEGVLEKVGALLAREPVGPPPGVRGHRAGVGVGHKLAPQDSNLDQRLQRPLSCH